MEYRIDATDKILGRLAGEVALLLRGKNKPSFDPAKLTQNRVVIVNIDLLRVTGKKMNQKRYLRHSGYPGGLRQEKLASVMARDSRVALRHAVSGMLPKNRLRAVFLRNLILHKGEMIDKKR